MLKDYRKLIAVSLGVLGHVAMAVTGVDPQTIDSVSTMIAGLVGAFLTSNLIEHKINKPITQPAKENPTS